MSELFHEYNISAMLDLSCCHLALFGFDPCHYYYCQKYDNLKSNQSQTNHQAMARLHGRQCCREFPLWGYVLPRHMLLISKLVLTDWSLHGRKPSAGVPCMIPSRRSMSPRYRPCFERSPRTTRRPNRPTCQRSVVLSNDRKLPLSNSSIP